MIAGMETPPGDGLLSPLAFARDDESPDADFYSVPRKVVHIDDGAIAALGALYAEVLPNDGRLLDLMSSWRSHLPQGFRAVVGLGMNAEEMADNPQLASHVVHDVNRLSRLPFADAEFDGAMCAVSIQYVLHPVLLLREVRRVLRPGAPFVVSFSNRCFPTKARSRRAPARAKGRARRLPRPRRGERNSPSGPKKPKRWSPGWPNSAGRTNVTAPPKSSAR